jgi:hypothetical protein
MPETNQMETTQPTGQITTDTCDWMLYETFMREYQALKGEQSARIGFRDNLLYVQLAAVGAVFAFARGVTAYADTLLVVPWISVILGWTYLANDHHISRIGGYIRKDLNSRMLVYFKCLKPGIFDWEPYHRADDVETNYRGLKQLRLRKVRKYVQLAVDLITFIASGAIAIVMFVSESKHLTTMEYIIVATELVCLAALSACICVYADLRKSEATPIPANSAINTKSVEQR